MFVIAEDQCEQIFLSICSELSLSLLNFFHYPFPILPGYPKTVTADEVPCFFVVRTTMRKEPISCSQFPLITEWFRYDAFIYQILLFLIPLWDGSLIAPWPQLVVIFLLVGIYLVLF